MIHNTMLQDSAKKASETVTCQRLGTLGRSIWTLKPKVFMVVRNPTTRTEAPQSQGVDTKLKTVGLGHGLLQSTFKRISHRD